MGRILYFILLALSSVAWAETFGPVVSPFTAVCESASAVRPAIPDGALWRKETIRQKTAPAGFGAAVGWINAATTSSCVPKGASAEIEIRSIRLIERLAGTGRETIIREITFDAADKAVFESRIFPRIPKWFGETEGSGYPRASRFHDGSLSIDLTKVSRRVYHGWTAPRSAITPGAVYFLEVTARISGDARLQLGLDYWRDTEVPYNGYEDFCRGTNNCEAWISKWYGDTGGEFATFRAPRSL